MSEIKINFKTEIIPILMIVLSFIAGIYFYQRFPERVASRWNFQGEVDGYSSKTFGAFGLPIIIGLMYLMFLILPRIDPQKQRYSEFAQTYRLFKNIIIGFMLLIYGVTGLANLGYNLPIGIVIPLIIGVLFIIMGQQMPGIKPNWFLGIRTPWTLSNENVWNKTHQVGGRLFVLLGLVLMIMPLIPENLAMILFFAAIVATVGGTFLYSYLIYRKIK